MTYTAVDLEKFSLADFSLHAASNPLGLGQVRPFACRARSDVKNRAGTRTAAQIPPQIQLGVTTCGRQKAPDGSRGASGRPKGAVGRLQEASSRPPRGHQTTPGAPLDLPWASPDVSKRLQVGFRVASGRPKAPLDVSKRLQVGILAHVRSGQVRSRDERRRDETRRAETRRDETKRDETRQDKTRRGEARRDKTIGYEM